jgi:hypothetical protein
VFKTYFVNNTFHNVGGGERICVLCVLCVVCAVCVLGELGK